MKTRNLLLMSAFLACFFMTAFAQEDITPERYKFANLPVGKFVIDEVNAGANPPAGWTAVAAGYDNGFVALCGGPAVFTSKDVPAFVGFQEGTNIIDLGGDVGKVLSIKGPKSNSEAGIAMGNGFTGQWCNLNLYFDKDMTPVNEVLRLRMVFSIYENEISSEGSLLGKYYTSTSQNNTYPLHTDPQVNNFRSDSFVVLDEDNNPIYDPSKWMIHEFDVKVPNAEGNPTRLKIEFDAGRLVNGTLFIKEIQLIKDPVGEPIQRELVTYNPAMSINSDLLISNQSEVPSPHLLIKEGVEVIVAGDAIEIESLLIETGASVIVNPGKSLTIGGNVKNNGNFILKSDYQNGTATLISDVAFEATVEQAINLDRSWYMSLPVANGDYATGVSEFYQFTESSDKWEEASAFTPGKGLMVNPVNGNSTMMTFQDTLNSGTYTFDNLSNSNRRFHYMGNPYPSYLSWGDLTKVNLEETIWFRTENEGNYQFATNNGVTGTLETDGTIAPLQGFWVQVEAGEGVLGKLEFDNGMRKHYESAMHKPLRTPQVELNLLRLQITDGKLKDEAIIYFKEENSNGKDRFDAAKMMNNNDIPAIWTVVNNEATVINAMQTIPYNVDMVLGFSTKKADQFTISASQFDAFFEGNQLLLIDKENGNTTDLISGDYSFSSGVTNTSERFVIRFVPGSVTGLQDKSVDNSYVYVQGSDIIVNLGGVADARATVYSVSGQQVASQLLQTNSTTIARGVNKGVYLVIIDNGVSRVSKRVIVK